MSDDTNALCSPLVQWHQHLIYYFCLVLQSVFRELQHPEVKSNLVKFTEIPVEILRFLQSLFLIHWIFNKIQSCDEWLTHLCMDPGATLAVTEITPSPPIPTNTHPESSSPLNKRNFSPHRLRKGPTRFRSPVASLTPIIIGWFENSAIVSGFMSTPVLPGQLYTIIGRGTESAIVRKCLISALGGGFT